jgi:hypothetical protein
MFYKHKDTTHIHPPPRCICIISGHKQDIKLICDLISGSGRGVGSQHTNQPKTKQCTHLCPLIRWACGGRAAAGVAPTAASLPFTAAVAEKTPVATAMVGGGNNQQSTINNQPKAAAATVVTETATTAMTTNDIEGGKAAMEMAVALQRRGGGSTSAVAAWRQHSISCGSSTAVRWVAGRGGSFLVAARRRRPRQHSGNAVASQWQRGGESLVVAVAAWRQRQRGGRGGFTAAEVAVGYGHDEGGKW